MDNEWYASGKNLTESIKHLHDTQILSDCEFKLENKTIRAHKLILATSSPVFLAMFYGELPEEGQFIEIQDIEFDAFSQLLKFIYTDEITFTSEKNAYDVYNAAKKYIINNLEKTSIKFLMENLNNDNVIEIYEFAKFHNEQPLMDHCMNWIQENTMNVITNEYILEATENTLEAILDSKQINVKSEADLVRTVIKWGLAECDRQKVPESSMKSITAKLVKKLRLLTLTSDEFLDVLLESFLLDSNDKVMVLRRILKPELILENNSNICEERNRRPTYEYKVELRHKMEIQNNKCNEKNWARTSFTVNAKIILTGAELNIGNNETLENVKQESAKNEIVILKFENSINHLANGTLRNHLPAFDPSNNHLSENIKLQISFTSRPVLEPHVSYLLYILLVKNGVYPFGGDTQLKSVCNNVEFNFTTRRLSYDSQSYSTVLNSLLFMKV